MNIDNFTLVNNEKLDRAINGTIGREGQLTGGVGKDASLEVIIAEYDRLGGLILKGKNKVKTGSFYDFKNKKARNKPEVVLLFRDLEGNEIEIPDGEEIPIEVKAAELAQNIKNKKTSKKTVKKIEEDEE